MDLLGKTFDLVLQIPKGKVSTYGEVAKALGDKAATRAVGRVLGRSKTGIPCYRVVHTNGELGGYKHGVDEKTKLLLREGIIVEKGRVRNFKQKLFIDFSTDYPLHKLRKEQLSLAKKVVLKDVCEKRLVAGVDVAYKGDYGYGALIVFDMGCEKIVTRKTIQKRVEFPYIPTYLAYREIPVYTELLKGCKDCIVLVDGNGVLHPLHLGIASHLGVMFNLPTIGVAKKLLCGKPNFIPKRSQASEVYYEGKKIGYCVRPTRGKPIYVSPGHLVSFATALRIVKKLCNGAPEPLREADRLARNQAKQNPSGAL